MELGVLLQRLFKEAALTLYMVGVSTVFTVLFGLPLGVWLVTSAKDGLRPQPMLNRVLGFIVNVGRSLPFIILLLVLIPFTRAIVGTAIGSTAAIVPLTIAAIPFLPGLPKRPCERWTRPGGCCPVYGCQQVAGSFKGAYP